MPTVLTHAVVPLAAGWGLGRRAVGRRLLAAGVVASMLPDLDVLAFRFGIPYAAAFGHRGFSHSLLFALAVAALGAGLAAWLRAGRWQAFCFLFLAAASHGLLDACTNGGLGIALWWPFDGTRYFAPFHPIEVSPFGLSRLLSARGWAVLRSELLWVWLPLFGAATVALVWRRQGAWAWGRRGRPDGGAARAAETPCEP